MRISLNNIRDIERYNDGSMEQNEVILFENKMQCDGMLKMHVMLHKKILTLVRMYHRQALRVELEDVHQRLFSDPSKLGFRERVQKVFGEY